MLSVAKLTPGQEAYYERSVAVGLDDYYAGKGESPGVWTGRGAASLGLEGGVDEGELGALVRGNHPKTRDELRAHVKARTIRIERIDAASGKRWLEEKKLAPVAGFDLVFSTPKSVSLLHALGDEEARAAIGEAHLCAWRAALSYLEEEACVTRRGKDGFIRERGGGFVAASYQHRTSRAQDPHLHTHVIVANMTRSPSDGEWRALDGEALLKTYRLAAGYLYEAHLRFELSARLGLEWEEPEKGWAELKGVPRTVIEAFSTRRAQVVEHMSGQATSGFYAAQVAAVASRERKEELDLPRLNEEWRARAAEHGLGQKELEGLLHRAPYREPSPAELVALAEHMLGPEGLTEKRSAFSAPELVMAWAQAHGEGASVERIRSISARFLELPGIARVGEIPAPGRATHYSTAGLLRIEREALALVERGRDGAAPVVPPADLDDLLRERAERLLLSPEQERMVRSVATSPDRVVSVVGLAGSGKTMATHALAQAFATAGAQMLGPPPPGLPPSVCRTRAASRQRRSTASSPRQDKRAASHPPASSSSTRRAWRRHASSRPCSRSSSRRTGRRCSSATSASSLPSARAASSRPSSSATAPSSSGRTAANRTSSSGARWRPSAAAWGASTSPSPSATSASSSRRVRCRREPASWATGGRPRRRTCREAS